MIYEGKRVLILFEGPDDKKQFKHLGKTFVSFLNEGNYQLSVFTTSIYELFEPLIQNKEFDSLPAYLQSKKLFAFPVGTRPQDYFSLIYLVFDFDPKYHLYSPEKIKALQTYFNDETQKGLLYINYPMLEALFDCKKEGASIRITKERPLSCCSSDSYKHLIRKETPFANPKNGHPFNYLPPKPFAMVSIDSMKRYFEILKIESPLFWSFSDIAGVLKEENEAATHGKIFPLSCFPFMALDYNSKEAIEIWNSVLRP
jgi:hypothetical protein